jgi:hypothetical protein
LQNKFLVTLSGSSREIIANIKVVHCAIVNPTSLPNILPLEQHDNENSAAEQYEAFSREAVKFVSDHASAMEICEVIVVPSQHRSSGFANFWKLLISFSQQSCIFHVLII